MTLERRRADWNSEVAIPHVKTFDSMKKEEKAVHARGSKRAED